MVQSNDSLELPSGPQYQNIGLHSETRRSLFTVFALVLVLAALLTLASAYLMNFDVATTALFYGLTVAGPFAILGILAFGGGSILPLPLTVSVIIALWTIYGLLRPSKMGFVLSVTGGIAWAFLVPILVVLLPILKIRF